MAAVVALGVFGVSRVLGGAPSDRFVENVYINGVSLAGYTQEEGRAMMAELRERWLNTTYTLSFQDRSWSFTPSDFDANIEFDSELERAWNLGHVGSWSARRQVVAGLATMPAELNCEPTYDSAKLDAFIADMAAQIDVEPVDAMVTLTAEKPVISQPSQTGWRLDQARTKANLEQLIKTGAADTTLPVEEVQPSIASDDVEMKIVAKFTTDVSFRNYDSRYNVRLALGYFNAFTIYPGDTVDFNKVVGPRNEGTGFRKAPEYAGNDTKEGYGGGVCQASTTLYNAVIMTGLEIIERHPHTMTVSYVQPSQDAAVEWGGKNFVFQNDTEYTYYVFTEVGGETATVTIYGTRPKYHYVLESNVIREQKSDRVRYQDDVDGTHVYYTTDQPVLYREGRGSCESEGWIVAYDWNTKEEVSREKESYDLYRPGYNVYWRGVHDPNVGVISDY